MVKRRAALQRTNILWLKPSAITSMDSWRTRTVLIKRDLSAWRDFVETFLVICTSQRTRITHTPAHDSRTTSHHLRWQSHKSGFHAVFYCLTFYRWSTPFIWTAIYSVPSYYIWPHEYYWLAGNYNTSSMSTVISMLLVRTQCDSQRSASLLRPTELFFWVKYLPISLHLLSLQAFPQLISKTST